MNTSEREKRQKYSVRRIKKSESEVKNVAILGISWTRLHFIRHTNETRCVYAHRVEFTVDWIFKRIFICPWN